MTKYKIIVTEEQAQIISEACELLARIKQGQIACIAEHLPFNKEIGGKSELDLIERLEEAYKPFKRANFKIDPAFTLHTVIRYRLANDKNPNNPNAHLDVRYDKPVAFNNEPLIRIEKILK